MYSTAAERTVAGERAVGQRRIAAVEVGRVAAVPPAEIASRAGPLRVYPQLIRQIVR